jgi:serine/threonine protein kinase/Tol biopolymer transport system component
VNAERWGEIQASFDELVELNASNRAARLETLASSDPELHRALESLLKADAAASADLRVIDAAFLLQSDRGRDPLGLTGRTISHFDLHEALGAGGMGVVYRADDTRLGRVVALKFLFPHYNLDASAKARFLREAHAAAALDHPNLCIVHEVGTSDEGWLFLAMALYQGETLRARLTRDGSILVREALEIARQIAEGLQAAHAAGIVHRDLKPGNVMLLPDGTVRILDFGLAKARDQSLSEAGVRFGTVSYMSPEQIRGGNVDGRSDLWAHGVVLYEMLTGRKPFSGDEEVAIAHAILHDEPELPSTHRGDISAALEGIVLRLLEKEPAKRYAHAAELLRDLARTRPLTDGTTGPLQAADARVIAEEPRPLTTQRRHVPPNVAPAVSHALEKVPVDRFASAHEFAEALNNPAFTLSSTSATALSQDRSTRRLRQMLYGVTALAILLTVTLVWGWMHPAPAKQVVRYSLVFDSAEAMIQPIGYFWGRLALSPDGSRLAYVGGPHAQILVRQRNQLHATAIPGSDGAQNPFFSPDGQHVGFVTGGSKLQIASLSGGPLITVTDSLIGLAGASWGRDGYIYVDGTGPEPLIRVEAKAGAVPMRFTALDSRELDHSWPEVLPNGKAILIAVGVRDAARSIGVVDMSSRKHRVIVNNAVYARYVPTGHLLYVTTDRTLMVVPFDQNTMKITGEPTALVEGVRLTPSSTVDLAVSDKGTLLYTRGAGTGKQELVWVTRDGKAQPVDPDWQGTFGDPSLAPDGRRLAVSLLPNASYDAVAQTNDIWIKQLDRGPSIKLTLEGKSDRYTAWTPDGRSVTFTSNAAGSFDLWTKRADGSTLAVLQVHEKRGAYSPRWSPDGKWLVFRRGDAAKGDILGFRPGIDTVAVSLVATKFSEIAPAISPDGRWLAYTSNESGQYDVYVVPFPNTAAAKWAVSTGGGTEPLWSHTGKELFYRDVSGNLVAVEVRSTPTFSLGRSTALFPASAYFSYANGAQYAVAPDDRRFIMIRRVAGSAPDELVVVDNWFEELKAKSRK